MNLEPSDAQKMLVATVHRFVRTELAPLEDEVESSGRPAAATALTIHAKARALGLYAMNVPAAPGGGGLSALEPMLCGAQFGHGPAAFPVATVARLSNNPSLDPMKPMTPMTPMTPMAHLTHRSTTRNPP